MVNETAPKIWHRVTMPKL